MPQKKEPSLKLPLFGQQSSHIHPARAWRVNDVNRLSKPVSTIVVEPVPCCDRMKAHASPMSVYGSRKVLLHLVDV